jgi:hypothetical protein
MPITDIYGPFASEIASYVNITTEGGIDLVTEGGINIIVDSSIVGHESAGGEACCPSTEIPFTDAVSTEVLYSPELKAKHGPVPQVTVYYYNTASDGSFTIVGAYTRKVLRGNPVETIFVDHGGPQTGFIKII